MWATDLLKHFLQTIVFSFCCVCFGLFPSIDSDLQQAIGSRSSETSYYYYYDDDYYYYSYSSCSDYSSKSLTTLTTPPPPPATATTTTTTPPNPLSKKAPLFFEQAPPPLLWTSSLPFQQGGNPSTKGIWVLWTSLSCKEIPWMEAPFIENSVILAWENVTLFTLTSLHQMQ